jgi:hypothetical protein
MRYGMKRYVVLFLCFISASAEAHDFQFRGDLIETHIAEEGFLDKIPHGIKLNCEQGLCSYSKSVRIYVFKNRDIIKSFWSTDYCDVMFDVPETMLPCGDARNIVHYDETGQLLSREDACHTGEDAPFQKVSHYRL